MVHEFGFDERMLVKLIDEHFTDLQGMPRFYSRDLEELSVGEWVVLAQSPVYRWLAKTDSARVQVSTVWTGVDYSFSRFDPHVFETMVRGTDFEEISRWRCEGEALAGHQELAQRYGCRLG